MKTTTAILQRRNSFLSYLIFIQNNLLTRTVTDANNKTVTTLSDKYGRVTNVISESRTSLLVLPNAGIVLVKIYYICRDYLGSITHGECRWFFETGVKLRCLGKIEKSRYASCLCIRKRTGIVFGQRIHRARTPALVRADQYEFCG